jgi:hypothetical protein
MPMIGEAMGALTLAPGNLTPRHVLVAGSDLPSSDVARPDYAAAPRTSTGTRLKAGVPQRGSMTAFISTFTSG